MGYCAQQHDTSFLVTDQDGAHEALAKDIDEFNEAMSLEAMFDDIGWEWKPHIHGDDLYQSISKVLSICDKFFETLAPFVKDGSYIAMVGEDNAIWRWYFTKGKCESQSGALSWPKPNKALQTKRTGAGKSLPPGINEGEAFIDTVGGEKIVFPSADVELEGASRVRFVDEKGVEIVYWDSKEWKEDPEVVMGAILGAMSSGATPF
jgi:hypothetical protein